MDYFKKVICSLGSDACPYKKSHCCLCEICIESINTEKPVVIRHKCKVKNSRMVIGTTAA